MHQTDGQDEATLDALRIDALTFWKSFVKEDLIFFALHRAQEIKLVDR